MSVKSLNLLFRSHDTWEGGAEHRERRECFDFVYIDGSHFADDVMLDAVLAWQLLKAGGIAVFDDYLWRYAPYAWRRNPAAAINLFLRLIGRDGELLHVGHQLAVRKTESLARYA